MADQILIETVVVGLLETNCYIVYEPSTKEAAVIDPGADAERVITAIKDKELKVCYIFNTHGHYDHIGADAAIAGETSADVYIGKDDEPLLKGTEADPAMYLGGAYKTVEATKPLGDGEVFKIGSASLMAIHTPGHTRGGVSFRMGKSLFAGDTLFAGSIGRTDLPGGDFETLIESIKARILVLPDETVVYPGHGPATTVGVERLTNPYLI